MHAVVARGDINVEVSQVAQATWWYQAHSQHIRNTSTTAVQLGRDRELVKIQLWLGLQLYD